MPQGKPKGIQRKLAANLPTWKEKFELSDRGELFGVHEAGLIERLSNFVKWFVSKGHPKRGHKAIAQWKADARQFRSLALRAAERLDESFFSNCAKTIKWLKDGTPLADPLGDNLLRVIVKLARLKGRGQKITWNEVIEELDYQHPKMETVYDADVVRRAARQLKIGRFPLSTDVVHDELRKIDKPRQV